MNRKTIEQTAEHLVRSELLLNVSALVHDATRSHWITEDNGEDELFDLWTGPVDCEAALEDAGHDAVAEMNLAEQREYCESYDIDLDDYRREVYEHWAVAPMLADNLEAHGETVVRDWHGMDVWARTTTGQTITMDDVIQRIARDIDKQG